MGGEDCKKGSETVEFKNDKFSSESASTPLCPDVSVSALLASVDGVQGVTITDGRCTSEVLLKSSSEPPEEQKLVSGGRGGRRGTLFGSDNMSAKCGADELEK